MVIPIAIDFSKVTPSQEQLKIVPDTRYTAVCWPDVTVMVSINTDLQKVDHFTFT